MRYEELVQFEPIQSVKVLKDADDQGQAAEDVRTFVFSDRLLDELGGIVVPHLNLDKPPKDEKANKGLLVVANYGTGKTHLMSVIAAVAEQESLLADLTRAEARETLAPIAGRFNVIRAEIGATQMPLRDIVCGELTKGLKDIGVNYKFKKLDEVSNTKDSLVEMMASFGKVHGDTGLLFVLDELLDFLRGRRDQELNLDLRFLREVGEIVGSTRFRFIGGVQEALFDNPRFANVASEIIRVKDRFEQARIHRDDVEYVVKERLLHKTIQQRDEIRDYLQPFTPLYDGMAENLEDFVELFPVHPAYLQVFSQITAVEKREVLRTLSQEMTGMLDRDVPLESPGLISYDSYRQRLDDDPSARSIEDVKKVLDTTGKLRFSIEKGLAKEQYKPTALRMIDGLAVHRLTTGDIRAPIGLTAEQLRDDLCLLPPDLPEVDATFLKITIDTVVDEIVKAVSGQFITENPDNAQIYLDVDKDVDYEQKISERAASLDDEKLDEAYFQALGQVLDVNTAPYVSGYRIWEYDVVWANHGVTRFGYLFFGAPNERSTAQPPRDFYIYFLQPYDPPSFKDEEQRDEVFFRLGHPDEQFTGALRTYAGARALANESTAKSRDIYLDKAEKALQAMVSWLRRHMGEAITATYKGETKPLASWLRVAQGSRATVKEQVDTIASDSLAGHFETRYPGYPKFAADITRANLAETVKQALVHIATGRKSDLSARVLLSLELLDSGGSFTIEGRFAKTLLDDLSAAGGKVLNRSDLLSERDPGVPSWGASYLEPAWVVVIAAALTQLGRAEIGFAGGQIDALGLEQLTKMSFDELTSFSFVAPPKQLPVVQLKAVVKLLGLPEGIVKDQGVTADGVAQILDAVESLLVRVTAARTAVQSATQLWGALILEQPEERDQRLGALQDLLQAIRARNTVGKMNKLDTTQSTIDAASAGVTELDRVDAALAAKAHLSDTTEYLREAVDVFGEQVDLSMDTKVYRDQVLDLFREAEGPDRGAVAKLRKSGEELRKKFAEEAARAHARDRLDAAGDEQKRRVLEGAEFSDLRQLAAVSLIPEGPFAGLQGELVSIGTCKTFDETNLLRSVVCSECGYRPHVSSGATAKAQVDWIEGETHRLREEWVKALLDSLRAPELQEQIDLLKADDLTLVQAFIEGGELPSPVSDNFIRALNQVFDRFEIRRVSREELWSALFPESAASTSGDIRTRLDTLLGRLSKGIAEDKLRIVPAADADHDQS